MTDLALTRDGKLIAASIATAPPPLSLDGSDAAERAALAIGAGLHGVNALTEPLVALLGNDGLDGQAAAWALGRLGAETALLRAATEGNLDARQNAFQGLAVIAALGKASPQLGTALGARIDAEVERAKAGRTGLGEYACRALAVLGAPDTDTRIQQVIDGDRFSDRFELSRLRRAITDGGRDQATSKLLAGPWTGIFADHLASDAAPAETKPAVSKPPLAEAAASKPAKSASSASPAPAAAPTAAGGVDYGAYAPGGEAVGPEIGDDENAGDEALGEADAPPSQAKPVDWKAFLASPEATALGPQLKSMAGQLGPMLEQIAVRAIRAQLADLSPQEYVALLLQVLPQMLPQQHVQAALSPQALTAYQAIGKFLHRTGAATHGDGLVQAIKLVRQQMREQIRRAGIIGGPDYSDPDEVAKPKLAT